MYSSLKIRSASYSDCHSMCDLVFRTNHFSTPFSKSFFFLFFYLCRIHRHLKKKLLCLFSTLPFHICAMSIDLHLLFPLSILPSFSPILSLFSLIFYLFCWNFLHQLRSMLNQMYIHLLFACSINLSDTTFSMISLHFVGVFFFSL